MRRAKFLTYRQAGAGQLKCTLNLPELFPTAKERKDFHRKFRVFLASDDYNHKVYRINGEHLLFESEQLIPAKRDIRTPLLMVFGNPAPQSVSEGMFFAFEGKGKEHRFWKHIIKPTGLLHFSLDADLPVRERNRYRKSKILSLDYLSRFRVGFTVFISLPSGASGPWSGISGIKKLLGARAMREVFAYERARVLKAAKEFLAGGGVVMTFQRDAWAGLRSRNDPPYSVATARQGKLKGMVNDMQNMRLYGLPPTRLVGPCRQALARVLEDAS